jgi:hypothetical protein
MKTIYSFLTTYLITRSPFYIAKKYFRSKLFKNHSSFNGIMTSSSLNFNNLLDDGVVVGKNLFDNNIIEKWKKRYGIDSQSFTPWVGNLSIPFFNQDVYSLLTDSEMLFYVNKYFHIVYGMKPVLQQIPMLVVTYPSVNQEEYQNKSHNFPASWHVDYKSEFTIHIPLTEINNKTSHTKYLKGTQNRISRPPGDLIVKPENKKLLDCFATPGDMIFLDVDGWHRAQLEKGTIRIFLQIKYTIGNDQLFYSDPSDKQLNSMKKIKEVAKNYDKIKECLTEDLFFIKNLPDNLEFKNILKNNSQLYPFFL